MSTAHTRVLVSLRVNDGGSSGIILTMSWRGIGERIGAKLNHLLHSEKTEPEAEAGPIVLVPTVKLERLLRACRTKTEEEVPSERSLILLLDAYREVDDAWSGEDGLEWKETSKRRLEVNDFLGEAERILGRYGKIS